MTTAALVLLAFSIGACLGYVLCAVMTVAGEEQSRSEQAGIPDAPPLEPDSLP